ncbi:MAG: PKD domain-containing protein [Ktedonobacterales bacterium]
MYNTPYPTQPPTMTPPAPYPPAGPGQRRSWPRLALLVVGIIVLASFLPATLPKTAASARKAAYPQPVISITASAGSPYRTGNAVTFSVNVQAGKNLTYSWDVNGQNLTGPSVTTTFTDAGQGTAQVTATDPIGQQASAHVDFNVLPPPPVACFTDSPDFYSTYYIAFDATCAQGQIQQYNWDFGDGQTDQTFSPQDYHDYYPATGTFTVTLTVTDNYGQTNATTQTVTVTGQ